MQLWKIIYRDNKTEHVRALTRHQVLTEMIPTRAVHIEHIDMAEYTRHCGGITHAPAGIPGHRG